MTTVEDRKVETIGCGLSFEAIFVSGKVPTYVKTPPANCDGAAVAYKLIDTRDWLVAPLCSGDQSKSTNGLLRRPPSATVFCSMAASGPTTRWSFAASGTRTASAMGHIPISGSDGQPRAAQRSSNQKDLYSHQQHQSHSR